MCSLAKKNGWAGDVSVSRPAPWSFVLLYESTHQVGGLLTLFAVCAYERFGGSGESLDVPFAQGGLVATVHGTDHVLDAGDVIAFAQRSKGPRRALWR